MPAFRQTRPQRKTAKRVELASFRSRKTHVVEMKDVNWIARIFWASQQFQPKYRGGRGRGKLRPLLYLTVDSGLTVESRYDSTSELSSDYRLHCDSWLEV